MNTNVTTIIYQQTPMWPRGHWCDCHENLDETHEKFDVEICDFCTINNGEPSVNKDRLWTRCKHQVMVNQVQTRTSCQLAVSNKWWQTICEQGWVTNQVPATSDGELSVNKDGLPTWCEQQVMRNHVWTRTWCQTCVSKKWWQTTC